MYGLKGCCSQVIFREVFCHEYGKIPRHTGQNPITEGDMEWILTKLLWTEWTVTLKVKNVYGQSHLCLDSFISASGGSSYLSFLTNPSMVAPSRIFLNTKATIVFMYFSLLSSKDTLYLIFFGFSGCLIIMIRSIHYFRQVRNIQYENNTKGCAAVTSPLP